MSFSHEVDLQLGEDIQSEIVAEAGDIGDRALSNERHHGSGTSSSLRFSFDRLRCVENGLVTFPDDALVHSNGYLSNGLNTSSSISPVPLEIQSHLSSDAILYLKETDQSSSQMQDKDKQFKDNQKKLPQWLEYVSCLTHLAVFGILGVLTRYLLQKLFGPGLAGITSDDGPLYLDLPSNMVGSFLMGWLGVVFKGDISQVSDLLAIGLTTGFLGSLTTFSGWNQKMLDLASKGKWVFASVGFLLGMLLAEMSILVGVETAKGFRFILMRYNRFNASNWSGDSKKQTAALLVFLLLLGLLWGVSIALLKTRIEADETTVQLWLACLVGPPGVWARWFLARLNGHGLGMAGSLKWVPSGTLLANILAACLMAALATVKKVVNTKRCGIIVNGMQFGFLGCLSTVSTFVAEVYAMKQSKYPWRAYLYIMFTIIPSFAFGTLIFSVPVWAEGYQ